jgi:hypothetical protein
MRQWLKPVPSVATGYQWPLGVLVFNIVVMRGTKRQFTQNLQRDCHSRTESSGYITTGFQCDISELDGGVSIFGAPRGFFELNCIVSFS